MSDTFDCPEHGAHKLCLACLHIVEEASDSFIPLGNDDLPVALCDDCDGDCQGEWSDLDPDDLDALCEACFWRRSGLLDSSADAMVDGNLKALAVREMGGRSAVLGQQLGERHLPRWRWSDDNVLDLLDATGTPVWSLLCDHLGAWSDSKKGFLWAFANPTVPAGQRARAWQLRGMGDRLGVGFLQRDQIEDCTLAAAWILASIAGVLVGARGLRCLDLGDVKVFLAVQDAWAIDRDGPAHSFPAGADPSTISFEE